MPAQKRPHPPPSPTASGGGGAGGEDSPPLPRHESHADPDGGGGGCGGEPTEKRAKLEENSKDTAAKRFGCVGSGGTDRDSRSESLGRDADSCSESEGGDAGKEEFIPVKLGDIRKEVQCPICLGIIRKTRTVMECLHRFCRECIDKSMRLGNNECPACRTHCASRRSLRDDPNYDALISALYPDIDKYEEEELAFNEEENDRNKQIQASIAEAFRKQLEVIGRRSNARATAAAFVRRSRRNMRDNGQNAYVRGRGRPSARDIALACSDDGEDGNGEDCGRELSSADECSPDKRQKRYQKWPTPRSSPARAACNDDVASDEKDDMGISIENLSTSPLRAWGKNGTRSQTRHGNSGGSNGRMVKGGRMVKLVECLRSSADIDIECHVHVCLIPLDGETMPELEKLYLCCRPTLSIRHLCQFVALQTSCKSEEVQIYARKSPYGDRISKSKANFDGAKLYPSVHLQIMAGEQCLADLHSSFTSPKGDLELVYAIKMKR